jgi:hypothetical protein
MVTVHHLSTSNGGLVENDLDTVDEHSSLGTPVPVSCSVRRLPLANLESEKNKLRNGTSSNESQTLKKDCMKKVTVNVYV